MPLFGFGSAMKRAGLEVPSRYFHDLATWSSINRMYEARVMADIRQVRHEAREPDLLDRLVRVVDEQRGHTLAMEVEEAKIALSDTRQADIPLEWVAPGLNAAIGRPDLVSHTRQLAERIAARIKLCLAQARMSARRSPRRCRRPASLKATPLVRSARASPSRRCDDMGRGTESGTNFRWRTRGGQAFFTEGRATWFKLQSMFGLIRFFGGSEPLAWTLQWMMSGTVVVALVLAWRSRLSYALKAAALATATLLVTPYLFLYDEMVLAIPVALLVRIGLADGFSEYELPALGCVALLLLSLPWVGAPVGLGATLIVTMLIVRRAGGPRTTMMSNMSTL